MSLKSARSRGRAIRPPIGRFRLFLRRLWHELAEPNVIGEYVEHVSPEAMRRPEVDLDWEVENGRPRW